MFNIFKKKPAPTPEVEKKPVSMTEIKVKYKMFDNQVKTYIQRQQSLADKHIQKATALKLKGLDATEEIKRIAFFQAKMQAADRRRSLMERQIETYEATQFEKEFIKTLGDMASFLGTIDLNMDEIEEVSKGIMEANMKIAAAEEKMNGKMEEMDTALSAIDASGSSDSLKSVEDSINAIIDKTISDAAFSAEETNAEDIARTVSGKLKVEA